jgi:hypothetical protein
VRSCNKYDEGDESDDSSDLGGADGKPPINQNQTEFSLKQFAIRIRPDDYSAFHMWKKVAVAGFLKKKPQSIMRGQNCLKQIQDGPLHGETEVTQCLATFNIWLLLVNFDNAEWILRQ